METSLVHVPAIIGEAVAGEAAKYRRQLESLVKKFNQSTFDIAELLHRIKKNGWYKPDFETFNDFLKSIDIKRRKAQYLERIVDVMEQVHIERNTYEPLGTAKLREITSLDPNGIWKNPTTGEETPMKDFITEFVEKGKEMPLNTKDGVTGIREHVRTLKGFVGMNDTINKTFGWVRSAFEGVIEPALEKARRLIGSVGRDPETGNAIDPSDSRCIEMICMEFNNDPANNVLDEKTEQEYVVEE